MEVLLYIFCQTDHLTYVDWIIVQLDITPLYYEFFLYHAATDLLGHIRYCFVLSVSLLLLLS